MSNIVEERKKLIAGLATRTSNSKAVETIPNLWARFYGDGTAALIDGKVSDDVYAVYTKFENEGKNNEGEYTFLIGVEVADPQNLSDGLEVVSIPASNYHRFGVPENKPENVFPTWMKIWPNENIGKTFRCDFELYDSAGEISINVGTTQGD